MNVHDFPSHAQGHATPYGTYEVAGNRAVVNVGISHDTAEFAVESIRRWWKMDGRRRYEGAERVLILADGRGVTAVEHEAGRSITTAACPWPPSPARKSPTWRGWPAWR